MRHVGSAVGRQTGRTAAIVDAYQFNTVSPRRARHVLDGETSGFRSETYGEMKTFGAVSKAFGKKREKVRSVMFPRRLTRTEEKR